MKNALFIFIVFVILSIVMTLVVTLAVFLIMSSFSMIAGERLVFLEFSSFFQILMQCLPFCLVLACLGLIFYFIRHPEKSIFPKLVYFLLGLGIWLFFIPFLISLQKPVKTIDAESNQRLLSTGFFRNTNNSIDFITKILPNSDAQGVRITNTNEMESFYFDESYLNKSLQIDPLFEKTVQLTPILEVLKEFYIFAQKEVLLSLEQGYLAYLMFASFGFALLSIFFIKHLSSWKLINISFVVALFVFICKLNRSIFASLYFARIFDYFYKNKLIWLSNKNNFQFFINMSISCILILIGLIHYIVESKKLKSVDDENI